MENSKEKYWKKEMENNYIQAMDADVELLVKLIDIARGKKSMERYLHDCELSLSLVSNLVYGNVKRIHVKDIFLIMQNIPDGCPVTEELLLAANGTYKLGSKAVTEWKMRASVRRQRKKIRKLNVPASVTSTSSCRARKEKGEPAGAVQPQKVVVAEFGEKYDDYDAFIEDLSFYGRRKPESELFFMKRNQKLLFENEAFCRALFLYRRYLSLEREQRASDMKEFYATGTGPVARISEADRYKAVLDSVVQAGMAKEGTL